MTTSDLISSTRQVGSTGWTIDDLSDPAIDRFWEAGSYEIIEGVLTNMPAAYADGTGPLSLLHEMILLHIRGKGIRGRFYFETDFVLSSMRVIKPDLLYMSPDDLNHQRAAHKAEGKQLELALGRILVPPTLVIESISLGHELHDTQTKRKWYAEARVPNYWIIDGFRKTLTCHILDADAYRIDCSNEHEQIFKPSAFPGLTIDSQLLWA